MIMMAPISSNIARDVRNIFMLVGTREPNKDNIPSANAMSVAAGIAQPFMAVASPALKYV